MSQTIYKAYKLRFDVIFVVSASISIMVIFLSRQSVSKQKKLYED